MHRIKREDIISCGKEVTKFEVLKDESIWKRVCNRHESKEKLQMLLWIKRAVKQQQELDNA